MYKREISIPTWEEFDRYIEKLRQEWDFFEQCYALGIDGIVDHIHSMDIAIKLLSKMFGDKKEEIADWIYEYDFGRRDNSCSVYNMYCKLIYNYLVMKGVEDISLKEECLQEK